MPADVLFPTAADTSDSSSSSSKQQQQQHDAASHDGIGRKEGKRTKQTKRTVFCASLEIVERGSDEQHALRAYHLDVLHRIFYARRRRLRSESAKRRDVAPHRDRVVKRAAEADSAQRWTCLQLEQFRRRRRCDLDAEDGP